MVSQPHEDSLLRGTLCLRSDTAFYKVSVFRRMVSSGLLRRVALVRTDVSEEPGASFIGVTKSVN
jgi:hypothetical protein